ncbi:MAG: 3,4-dihydroxy-2-butanone-4-phosphate synthase [Thermoplasmata archaeon]
MTIEGVKTALESLNKGNFVLVYDADGREEETDFVIASQFVTSKVIRTMRKDGGGLICTTVHRPVGGKLGLPYLADVFYKMGEEYPVLRELIPNDIPYDTKSSFAITINHRKTFTGISDNDRALTISEFAKIAEKAITAEDGWTKKEFGRLFRAPGHVHLLNASKELLVKRKGHTELSTALMVMAGLIPTATICEMIGDDGKSLSKTPAKGYAKEHNLIFLEGFEIMEAWKAWSR